MLKYGGTRGPKSASDLSVRIARRAIKVVSFILASGRIVGSKQLVAIHATAGGGV